MLFEMLDELLMLFMDDWMIWGLGRAFFGRVPFWTSFASLSMMASNSLYTYNTNICKIWGALNTQLKTNHCIEIHPKSDTCIEIRIMTGLCIEIRIKNGHCIEMFIKSGMCIEMRIKSGLCIKICIKSGMCIEMYIKSGPYIEIRIKSNYVSWV